MRAALLVLLLAVAGLVVSSALRSRAGSAPPDLTRAHEVLDRFTSSSRPLVDVDLSALYAGRLELIDPRLALPTWHLHDFPAAARVHAAGSRCPVLPVAGPLDGSLAKAMRWSVSSCDDAGADLEDVLGVPPFMHPSGVSYAALARSRLPRSGDWVRAHVRSFHVLELAAIDPDVLPGDERGLAAVPAESWAALMRGEQLSLAGRSLVVAEHGPHGLTRLRLYRAADWEDSARRASLALVPRREGAVCGLPASGALCWRSLSFAERHRAVLAAATALSAALSVGAVIVIAIVHLRERRRAHLDRVHVLRTLTHELRTPATSLRLDIEPLRAAYDELPAACQEPLLRLSDGIERLQRELHRTARYMALFETDEGASARLVTAHAFASAGELLGEIAEEWPEAVQLVAASADGPVVTDATWLGLAVRNLVENGVRHGVPPVTVTWSLDRSDLVVRVADRGATPALSLRDAVLPFARAERSPGLGLGLALVERIAGLLGGRLTHRPSPTEFVLRVPAGGRS